MESLLLSECEVGWSLVGAEFSKRFLLETDNSDSSSHFSKEVILKALGKFLLHPWGSAQRRESSVQPPSRPYRNSWGLETHHTSGWRQLPLPGHGRSDEYTLEAYVEFSREEALGNVCGTEADSGDVHQSHEEEPAIWPTMDLDEVLWDCELHGRQDTTQAKPQEHACSCLPVLRSGEPVPLCHDEGRDARNTDDGCRWAEAVGSSRRSSRTRGQSSP